MRAIGWIVSGVVAIGAAGAIGIALHETGLSRSPATETGAPNPPSAAAPSGLASSADKVRLTVVWEDTSGTGGAGQVAAALRIANGWHVNAHPASLDFLVPTTVQVSLDGAPIAVKPRYPAGRTSDIELGGTAIRVYGDGAIINLTIPARAVRRARAGAPLRLTVRVQSCSDSGTCLAPANLRATLTPGGGHNVDT